VVGLGSLIRMGGRSAASCPGKLLAFTGKPERLQAREKTAGVIATVAKRNVWSSVSQCFLWPCPT